MHDEGPSPEDIRRFSGESGYCPNCGAEVHDLAQVCPQCFAPIGRDISSRPPLEDWLRHRWIAVIAILVLLGLILAFVWWRP